MDKRVDDLKAYVSTLEGKDKETGEKKIKKLVSEIEILGQIKSGTPHYEATKKGIEALSNWKVGQIIRGASKSKLEKIKNWFGDTGTTIGVQTGAIINKSGKVDKSKIIEALEKIGYTLEGDDFWTPSHTDGTKVMERKDGWIVLNRSAIPSDWT